jgi:hypothetical protein
MDIVNKDISVYASLGGIFGCIIGLLIAFGTSTIVPHMLTPSSITQFYGACTFFGVFGGMLLGAFIKLVLQFSDK